LSESVRPHYSAKRLISGGSYTASGLNNPNLQQHQQQQQQIFVNNNQQPVITNPANTLGYRNSFAYNTSRNNTYSNINNNNMNSLPNSQSFIMMNRFAQNPPLSSMSRQFNTNNYNNTNTNNNNNNNNNKQYY
jgi:hypothetical protein